MKKYVQPSFFKFGNDSLELVEFISQYREDSDLTFLEIGTGCGIISIELALRFPEIEIEVLEPLKEFYSFIRANIKTFGVSNIHLITSCFEEFSIEIDRKYNVIFFNPPYFWEEESRASPDVLRNQCRRMKKEIFYLWMERMENILTSKGKVFFSYRSSDIEKNIHMSETWEIKKLSRNNGGSLLFLQKKL